MAVTSFQVKRCEPELVVPAKPTPREFKKLSDIDNLQGLRHHLPLIWIYKNNGGGNNKVAGKDPVKVIREALGRGLVYYYPLAGRLIEDRDGKLMVDCNAQGMLLVEANADVKLQQLGHPIVPPFSFLDEVLYNVPGSDAIGNGCPLLLLQVTRFVCGGFIVGVRLTHSVWDGCGMIQFLNAVAEMAQGAQHPSVPPVWQRELLDARNPPRVTCIHNEFQLGINDTADQLKQLYESDIVQCSFTFTPKQIMSLRKHLPPHLATTCTKFELLTACLWKCRTLALNLDPQEVVQVSCTFSGLAKKHGLNLPLGYYGNVIATPSVASEAGVLSKKPFAYAVELLKKATSMASGEYIRSMADLLVTKRPTSKLKGNFMVSDTRNLKFEELDFGWGYPEYAGVAISYPFFSFYMKYKNNGEDLIVVLISLPRVAIDKFQQELKKMTDNNHGRQI